MPPLFFAMTNHHRILIVEDDLLLRELFGRALDQSGFFVDKARTVHDAFLILRARAKEISLVLTDYQLPDLTGFDLAQYVKREFPSIPVIGMSTLELIEEGQLTVFDVFLRKPSPLKVVVRTVFSLLDGEKQ